MAQRSGFYGVLDEQEIKPVASYRDVRGGLQKLIDGFRGRETPFLLSLMTTVAIGAMPSLGIVGVPFLGLMAFVAWRRSRKVEPAPLKLPMQTGRLDPNEPSPKNGAPTPARGIFHLGNERRSNAELWLTNSDCRQHFLVLGTTGAGKTETLLGFGANALSWSSGFLFCDGKGDVSLLVKVYAMLRRIGREDDLLVLNFMNDAAATRAGRVDTNTLNPFSTGTADELTQMLASLMDDAGGGSGDMWKGRAIALMTAVIKALVELRDKGRIDLNVGTIRDHLEFDVLYEMSGDRRGRQPKYPELSPESLEAIRKYLRSLPGYDPNPKPPSRGRGGGGGGDPDEVGPQNPTVYEQHGYLTMQFTRLLSSLRDVYGHIFGAAYADVDIMDVVLNRRVLVVMLPALKKSGDEINNLGKIVVANLKSMMGAVLGSSIEGTYDEVVGRRPTNAPSPFVCVLDEVGYYTVDGMAVMAAQARSLGFSLVFASQDIPAMRRRNEKEASSIIANTNIKIIMRLEDPADTAKLAIDRGDKAIRTRVQSFERQSGDFSSFYFDHGSATLEEVSRISLRDLVSQKEGEMHVLFKDSIVRARAFYADPEGSIEKGVLAPRANQFVRVPRPSENSDALRQGLALAELYDLLPTPGKPLDKEAATNLLNDLFRRHESTVSFIPEERPVLRVSNALQKLDDLLEHTQPGRKALAGAYALIAHVKEMLEQERNRGGPEDEDEDDLLAFAASDEATLAGPVRKRGEKPIVGRITPTGSAEDEGRVLPPRRDAQEAVAGEPVAPDMRRTEEVGASIPRETGAGRMLEDALSLQDEPSLQAALHDDLPDFDDEPIPQAAGKPGGASEPGPDSDGRGPHSAPGVGPAMATDPSADALGSVGENAEGRAGGTTGDEGRKTTRTRKRREGKSLKNWEEV